MKAMKIFASLTIVGVFALTMSGHTNQIPQTSPSERILEQQVSGINLTNITITNAMTTLLSSIGVPGGIAIVTKCGEDDKYTFVLSGSTLRNALDAIVAANPQYTWQVDDGLVSVSLIDGPPPMLDFHISELRLRGARTTNEAVNQLFTIPEIQKRIEALRLNYGFNRIGVSELRSPNSAFSTEIQQYNLTLKNITVREALNAIARAHGKAVWEYRERNCNGKTEFQIHFLVA